MLRIENTKAEIGLAMLQMARNMLTEQPDMARVALDMAETAFKNGLQPSRAPKGKARDESSVKRSKRRRAQKERERQPGQPRAM